MKVLQINSVCGIRSTGRICTDIAAVLTENGDDCKIAYGRETVPTVWQDYAVRIGTQTDVNCHAVMSRLFDNSGFGSYHATKRFLKWVREYDPDVIHLHNLHGYYIHVGLLFDYLKAAKKPVIWTFHDCWPFTGHCVHFDYIGCSKWEQGGCYSCPKRNAYPSSMWMDQSKKNFQKKSRLFTGIDNLTIVTPSSWLEDLVKRSFLSEYPVRVIHNGIDLSVFKPTTSDFRKQYGLQNKTVILGVATAWGSSKGLDDFVRLNSMTSENESIVLVGLTQKQIADLPEGIIGIERTNSTQELAEIYTAADVFVNLTYGDTYPTVNLEAQACGTPVLTYRTGGSVESVPDEHIVEKGDVTGMLDMIRKVTAQPAPLLHDIRSFSGKECYMSYQQLYHETLR